MSFLVVSRQSLVVSRQSLVVSRLGFVLLLTTCYSLILPAQDMNRAGGVVETLSLPFFGGRGYVNAGDSLAAEFVAKEFKIAKLKSYSDSYFQPFSFPVNTFPDRVSVKVNGKSLIAGKDYILDPASPSLKGKFKMLQLDSSVFSNPTISFPSDKKKLALVYSSAWEKRISKLSPELKSNIQSFPLLLKIVDKKLTYSVAREVEKQASIEILAKGFPAKPKKVKVEIENKFIPSHNARNVIGFVEGTTKKDSFLVVTAHYDHLGRMGKDTYFPGANDNASGVAMMLEMAHYFADSLHRLPYSVLFIGFAGEEAGLVGSQFYANNPLFPLSKIKFLLNLDLMGSGKDGISVVNGSVFGKEFGMLDSLNKANNYLPLVKPRGKAANSDHYHFSEKGVPAFFVYTMGEITAYHDVDDTPSVVTFSKFNEVFSLLTGFLSGL